MSIINAPQSLWTRVKISEFNNLENWREWFIDVMAIFALFGMPLGMLATFPIFIVQKHYGLIVFDVVIWLFVLFRVFIKSGPYLFRAYFWLVILYTMTITFFIALGPHHARSGWLVMCSVMAALTFGSFAAIVATSVNAAILMILYWVMGPENQAWAAEYAAPFGDWVMFVVNISGITLASSVPVGFLLKRLDLSLNHETETRIKLSAESEELQKTHTALKVEINERRQAVETLRASEEQYRLLAENVSDVIFTLDLNMNYAFVSPSVTRLRGYTVEEVMKQGIEQTLTPHSLELAEKILGEELTIEEKGSQNHKRSRKLELEMRCKDGSTVWTEVIVSFLRDEYNKPSGILGVTRDIADRKKTEEELYQSEKRYRELVENIDEVIYTLDLNGAITYISSACESILGYKPEEVIHRPSTEFIYPEDLNRLETEFQLAIKGQGEPSEYRLVHKSGGVHWVQTSSKPIFEGNKVIGLRGVLVNIHERKEAEEERKRLEAQLVQAQKMEAIGTLAGGIAHDFNNILGIIIGYGEMMQIFEVSEDSTMKSKLEQMLNAAYRAKDLIRQILTFSRQTEQELKLLQPSHIIKEALKFIRASLPSTIEIQQYIDSNTGLVLADPTQIHQVLMNLCSNAGHAMRETGGILNVSLTETDLDVQNAESYLDLDPGVYIKLTVSDTGRGMTPEVIERIFDPFFTTKKRGEGTGMGLSVVHGIVQSHGGSITVKSELGKGSIFNVFLPRIQSEAPQSETKTSLPAPTGNERILFVDDEKVLMDFGKELLEQLGYEVTARTSSIEALETFRAQPNRFDLVITDMTMPNITGVELAKKLMNIRSDIPIILCTGFSETVTQEKAEAVGIREFLLKPLSARDLAETVRKALGD
jgi:PAS domain S-box-containing protein